MFYFNPTLFHIYNDLQRKDFHFGAAVAIIPIFLTENERENASFFNASIFDPIFQSENGKLSRNVKPCLRYNGNF